MSASSVTLAANAASFTREAFNAHLARVQHLPAWWLDRKRAAYERFLMLPMPARANEGWRFSNISGVTLDGFKIPSGSVDFKKTTHADLGVAGAGTLLFANNRLAMQEPLAADAAKQGVVFDTLQNALLKHADLIKSHLLSQPSKLGSDKFAALHEAFLEDGAFIHVPKGVEVALPVGVF
ncbi:MAG TPA: Fe-S cluster assembly protein SufD, partial [Candidatus Didemnitutus sp.]|nr:Fe-S cluster assembly protein SufD [Candidatus Didemnitutus sp.]